MWVDGFGIWALDIARSASAGLHQIWHMMIILMPTTPTTVLESHDSALAHPGDHQLGFTVHEAFEQRKSCFHLVAAQAVSCLGDGVGFLLKAAV